MKLKKNNMKKLILTVIIITLGLTISSSTSALIGTNFDILPEQDPLFQNANFMPGDSVERYVRVTNKTTDSFLGGAWATGVNDDDGLGSALKLTITRDSTVIYHNTLADFFSQTYVSLPEIVGGATVDYIFSIYFEHQSGNDYQEKSVDFNISVGYGEDGPEPPPKNCTECGGSYPVVDPTPQCSDDAVSPINLSETHTETNTTITFTFTSNRTGVFPDENPRVFNKQNTPRHEMVTFVADYQSLGCLQDITLSIPAIASTLTPDKFDGTTSGTIGGDDEKGVSESEGFTSTSQNNLLASIFGFLPCGYWLIILLLALMVLTALDRGYALKRKIYMLVVLLAILILAIMGYIPCNWWIILIVALVLAYLLFRKRRKEY